MILVTPTPIRVAEQLHVPDDETLPISESPPSSRPSTPSITADGQPKSPRQRYPSGLRRNPNGNHVPLHRRGTSRTYERLEDLLRDAGYKETRVFTPDAERVAAGTGGGAAEEDEGTTKGPIDTVVGFLSGFLSKGNTPTPSRAPSRPVSPSPLAHKRPREQESTTHLGRPNTPSPSGSGSILASSSDPVTTARSGGDLSDTPTRHRSPRSQTYPLPAVAVGQAQAHALPALRPRPSASGLSYSEAGQARHALRQQALRHMSSAPHIPARRRSQLGPQHRTSSTRVVPAITLNSDDESAISAVATPVPPPPAMPTGWLESVARAVLRTNGAHVGKPAAHARGTRRAVERTGRPPQMAPLRAPSAPGEVRTAQVVCRSAPSSRSNSRVRKGKDRAPPVPVLASTAIEDDSLLYALGDRHSSETDSYDTEDEGELDLGRLLVPAKRQHSIRSLRKHLDRSQSSRVVSGREYAFPHRLHRPLSASGQIRTASFRRDRPTSGRSTPMGHHLYDDDASIVWSNSLRSYSRTGRDHAEDDDDGDENPRAGRHFEVPGMTSKRRAAIPWQNRPAY